MTRQIAIVLLAAASLAACAGPTPPLLFVQAQTVGITASAGTTSQGAELIVGYRDFDVAIVPVVVSDADGNPVKNADGTVATLTSYTSNGTGCNAPAGAPASAPTPSGTQPNCGVYDALSVLGQFEVGANSTPPAVTLGKFFATGSAASTLAQGFAGKLGK